HRLARLLLGPHNQHFAPVGHGVADEVDGLVQPGNGLLQVDNVDAVALGEDEALHLRVPAPCLMPEVDAGLQELLHADRCNQGILPLPCIDLAHAAPGTAALAVLALAYRAETVHGSESG